VCPDCGTTEADWVDKTGRYRIDQAWEATAVRCYGCQAIANVAAQIPEKERGVRVALRPAAGR
jgi:hypothetical protein